MFRSCVWQWKGRWSSAAEGLALYWWASLSSISEWVQKLYTEIQEKEYVKKHIITLCSHWSLISWLRSDKSQLCVVTKPWTVCILALMCSRTTKINNAILNGWYMKPLLFIKWSKTCPRLSFSSFYTYLGLCYVTALVFELCSRCSF